MYTFEDQLNLVKDETGLSDAPSVVKFTRDINRGGTKFMASLGREYNRKSRVTNLRATIQYYQYPEDALRIGLVIATNGGFRIPLTQVPDEEAWRLMTMTSYSGQPTHYFVRGFDEIGLYPTPSATVTDGLEIVFEPRHPYFRAMDVTNLTSGATVTVTNGEETVTSVGTPFTSAMVGRGFEVTDETDTRWYRIAAFVDTATITLENYYQGASGTLKTFRIGQVMDIPEEFAEGPAHWAINRHYKRRGNSDKAAEALAEYVSMRDEAKEEYSQQTSSQVINASDMTLNRAYSSFRGDAPASITT